MISVMCGTGILRVALLVACTAQAAVSQAPPRRPRLARDADTNDAVAYYRHAIERIRRVPREAANGLYWAERLDPGSAPTIYARHVTALLTNPSLIVGYIHRESDVLRRPEIRQADSILQRALWIDPFLHRGLEEVVLIEYARRVLPRDLWLLRREPLDDEVAHEMRRYFADADPFLAGRSAYGRADYRLALAYYATALQGNRNQERIHYERALAYYQLRRLDSAAIALREALREVRRAPAALRPVYESVAQWEYALGHLYELQGQTAAARDAFTRALDEDVRLYPAALRLAVLELAAGDTASALNRLTSVAATHDVYPVRLFLGALYSRIGRRDSAVTHLRRAAELEPWATAPWLAMGLALEAARDTTGAIAAYERFLALTRLSDPEALTIQHRLTGLRTGSGRQ
ncbi:MAG TPA: tetratricopeptide repeat protein [Gemmatimonadales bacterium]|nr:tetratricopeptide repeat protein [Gemmatimonadales bacterium]